MALLWDSIPHLVSSLSLIQSFVLKISQISHLFLVIFQLCHPDSQLNTEILFPSSHTSGLVRFLAPAISSVFMLTYSLSSKLVPPCNILWLSPPIPYSLICHLHSHTSFLAFLFAQWVPVLPVSPDSLPGLSLQFSCSVFTGRFLTVVCTARGTCGKWCIILCLSTSVKLPVLC